MKHMVVIAGCCAALATADFTGHVFLDLDIGSRLQTRNVKRHLDVPYGGHRFQRRGNGMAFGQSLQRPGMPMQRPVGRLRAEQYRNGVPGGRISDVGRNGAGEKDSSTSQVAKQKANGGTETPKALAMIQAKGPAAIHAMHPTDFTDRYLPVGKAGGLRVEHNHSVVAGGVVTGYPPPDGPTQHPDDHPLKAKGQARAVMGQVTAPAGGSGNIKLHTPERKEDIYVPGGSTHTHVAMAKHPDGKSKVVASVTNGGGVRVAAGPDIETVEQ